MLAGTFLIGLSGYLFLALIGHGRFDAATTAALSATYLLGNVLGPGIHVAVEQETSRVVSDALARGQALASATRRLLGVNAALTGLVLVVLLVLSPLLLDRVLGGRAGLIAALGLSVVGSAAVYVVRGVSGGRRRFRRYAATVALDGGTRIAGCGLLAVSGSQNPVGYATALCAGPAVAALLTARGARPPPGGTVVAPPGVARLTRDVGLLLVASALTMVLANLAPVVATGLLPADPAAAAGFAGAVVLTRVPLLFMSTVQALVLPAMTAAAAEGNRAHLRSTVARGLGVIAVIGVVAELGTWVLGRTAVAVLFGADRDTTGTGPLLWLTASAILFMAAQLLQPAMVALRRHRGLVIAWVAGTLAFAATFAVPVDPLTRGLAAQVGGPVVTLAVQLAVLAAYRRTPVVAAPA